MTPEKYIDKFMEMVCEDMDNAIYNNNEIAGEFDKGLQVTFVVDIAGTTTKYDYLPISQKHLKKIKRG